MDGFVKAFIKGSVIWLTLGVTLGVAMAAQPNWLVYRPAHLHMLTLGFVAMMIFGVGYHVIPRMIGHPLTSVRVPWWHWCCANAGLALMAAGFVVRVHLSQLGAAILAAGAVLSALGAYMFAYLIWRTMDGPDAIRRIAQHRRDAQVQLPILKLVANKNDAARPAMRRPLSHR